LSEQGGTPSTNESRPTRVASGDDVDRILAEIRTLKSSPEAAKPKDRWDKAAIISTFTGSVLIAAVATLFTVIYNNREADRQQAFRDQQIRAAEIDVVLKLMPQLTSENPEMRHVAESLLVRSNRQTHPRSGDSTAES
jgi:hypothetical protein